MIEPGPWRCAAARPITGWTAGGIPPQHRHRSRGGWSHPHRGIDAHDPTIDVRSGAHAPRSGAFGDLLGSVSSVNRPSRFEEYRYLGDKRSQRVYDLDAIDDDAEARVAEVIAAEQGTVFSPDSLAEARNRGYRPAT